MNGDPDRKTWVERPNQPPKPECCRTEGQAQASTTGDEGRTTVWKRTQGESQAASGSRTPLKQSSLETTQNNAGGDDVVSPEPNTEETDTGEVSRDLPGSQSVAREQRAVQKLGSPAASRGTNCGGQTGQEVQRQEDLPTGKQEQGIRPVHSSSGSGKRCPNPEQGVGRTTQPAKETSAVRTTDSSWRTSLRAITNKAAQDPKHRFGGLYRHQRLFQHIQHDWLLKMLALRVNDGALLGLIRKWLRAGILEEDGRIEHPESGTPQGGSVSPVLANVYLHYVLGLWFERRMRKGYRGQSRLFRFADDFVCCFDYRHEAEAFEVALAERMQKFGLELAADKTKRIRFGPWGGRHNGRFDFLGFEFSWGRGHRGQPTVQRRTSRKKLRGAVQRFTEWIKAERRSPLTELMETLRAKYAGHWNYYGIIGNAKSLSRYCYETSRILFKWLNRRSQRRSLTWSAFNRLLKRYQVPPPRVVETTTGVRRLPGLPEWSLKQTSQVKLFGEHYRAARA